ncbi:MAG: glycosyltransferase, partial [Clostridia bacterium]|nr:glycosyltransferase [Clostridia bacterium]
EVPNAQDYDYPKEVTRVILPKMDPANKASIKDRVEYLQFALKKYSVDLMLYHAWVAQSLFVDALAVKSAEIPFVVNNHGYLYYDAKCVNAYYAHHNMMVTEWYRFFDGIVVLSDVDYQWLKIRHKNVYKILNPLPFDVKAVEPTDVKDKRDILWVGRISCEKKLPSALNVLKTILDKGYETKLHVVGEAWPKDYQDVITEEIKKLDLQQNVILHGFHADTSKFYQNAGVMLMTSDFEGFSMVIAESKAYGVPTVLYDLPNLDFVRDGRGMITVPQNNVQMAADAIIKLLSDDELRVSYGKEARASIEDMYSESIAEKWVDIFNDVIANKDENHDCSGSLATAVDMLTDFVDTGLESRLRDLEYWINLKTSQPTVIQEDSKEKVLEMYRNGDLGFRYIRKYFRAWLKYKFKRKK